MRDLYIWCYNTNALIDMLTSPIAWRDNVYGCVFNCLSVHELECGREGAINGSFVI